eukprot:5373202-Prymnesium_polylepis.1
MSGSADDEWIRVDQLMMSGSADDEWIRTASRCRCAHVGERLGKGRGWVRGRLGGQVSGARECREGGPRV